MINYFKNILKGAVSERKRILIRKKSYQLLSIFYKGKKYYCNCCGKRFRKFKTYGFDKRKNARCPFCMSLERERLMKFYFEDYIKNRPVQKDKLRVLHFAPEYSLSELFKNNLCFEYYGADINPALADYVVDITKICFPDDYFDLIICSHVLGHIPDEKKAINELKRCLSNRGTLLVLTYIINNTELSLTIDQFNALHPQKDKIYHLHRSEFEKYLSSFGFNVNKYNYLGTFDSSFVQKYCLGNGQREFFYLCTKCI